MEPPAKKCRFSSPHSPTSMEKICEGYVPKNTSKSTSWALRVFRTWREQRNEHEDDKCPETLLEEPQVELLNFWLSRFVMEARREDGKPYPPSSINNILSGLYRFSKTCVPKGMVCPNFMNRKDPLFRDLTGAIQVRYRELRESGVGAMVRHAPVVTVEEEDRLWQSKVIGDHSPLALLSAIFFYVGKTFCIRGGDEQRLLKRSQFVRSYNPDCYTYTENGSKNHAGINFREANKVVPVYSNVKARPRCLVYLLDLYFKKFPSRATEMDLFYLRPKKSVSTSTSEWYDCAPIGRDKLKVFLNTMCSEAGIHEKKTNHSLRATGASALFNAGVPEKLIRDVTGHRSSALHLYERPTIEQKQSVSKVLVQGDNEFQKGKKNTPVSNGKENIHVQMCPTVTCSSNVFGSLFSGVNNCNITISPQNFSVNVCSSSSTSSLKHDDIDIDTLFSGVDVDQLFS